MKIAVTCENGMVFQHFGRTPEFAVYTVEEKKIIKKEVISCGEAGHSALAGLLQDSGIDLLICGGIGGGAQMALAAAGIRLIGGAEGNVDDVVNNLLQGELHVNPDFQCSHHHGEGHSCGEHGCGHGSCH